MDEYNKSNDKNEERPIVIRNTTDLQRLKLEKLMKNPDKLVVIPEKPKDRSMPNVPDFVRNVMGSSAGAGSGEFHVYRHLRRKEYARQKFIHEKSERERLNDEYHERLETNRKISEEKTAKKRAKRQKKKMKAKERAKNPKIEKSQSSEEESNHSDDSNLQDSNPENKNIQIVEENTIKQELTNEENKTDESNENLEEKLSEKSDNQNKNEKIEDIDDKNLSNSDK